MSYDGYYEYVPVGEKRRKAQQAAEKLRKKNPGIAPVLVSGRKLAVTWWGKAWNGNLESYSDYENRLDRGRSYVRNGAVLDLQISSGKVAALVQGSRAKPYQVEIEIKPLAKEAWEKIRKSCEGKIESLQELLEGHFPKALSELFTAKGSGLFPSPKEISLRCSCPDWASMCKHVSAVLYGIGARLDENPALFFTLRGVQVEELISQAIREKTRDLLGRAERKSRRILEEDDVMAVFGLDGAGPALNTGINPGIHAGIQEETGPKPKKRGRPRKNL